MSEHEVIAVEAMESSKEIDPSLSANTQAMISGAADLAASSDGMEEAKKALDASVSKMMAEPDPFMQMMIAIYEVIPGTLLYKEEKLIYDTESFEFITELNNHMTKMMGYYAKAGDYVATSNAGLPTEKGLATGGSGDDVWGLAAGDKYLEEMELLASMVNDEDFNGLPPDIVDAMNAAFAKIGVATSSSLWNGISGAYRYTGGADSHTCSFGLEGTSSCGSWKEKSSSHGLYEGTHKYEWFCRTTGVKGCATMKKDCWAAAGIHVQMKGSEYGHKYNCPSHLIHGGTPEGEYEMTVGDDDWTVVYDGSMPAAGGSHSADRVASFQPSVDSSTTGNLELQTTINSYSSTVEAEYMFDMEQYNTYVNTSGKASQAHIDQVGASSQRLTNISHA